MIDPSVALFFFFSFILQFFAFQRGFYRLPPLESDQQHPYPNLKQIFLSFIIYLGLSLTVPIIVRHLLRNMSFLNLALRHYLTLSFVVQLITMLLCFLMIFLYLRLQNPVQFRKLWNGTDLTPTRFFRYITVGAACWLLSFPLSVLADSLSELLVHSFVGPQVFEQDAVKVVKASLSESTLGTLCVLFSIVILAPLLEELLFRGCLQRGLRLIFKSRHLAILVSTAIFASFHLSTAQSWGNIPIFAALFVQGWFLGFLYEKEGSLYAPIALHATFNGINAFRILIFST